MFAGRLMGFMLLLVSASACDRGSSASEPPSHAASAAASSAPGTASIPELVPGVSLGPIRIGMTRAEVEALGLPTKPGLMATALDVGPYVVMLDGDRVGSVHVALHDLPTGARVGGAVFDGKTKIDAMAAKLKGCGPVQHNVGGDVIACEGGRALLIAGGPPGIPAIEVLSAEFAAKHPNTAGTAAP